MVAAPNNAAYTAVKHAVVGMTRNAAAEYGPQQLRINAVGPGYIRTPLLEDNLDAALGHRPELPVLRVRSHAPGRAAVRRLAEAL